MVPVSLPPLGALHESFVGSGIERLPKGSLCGMIPWTGVGVLSEQWPVQVPTTPTDPAERVPPAPVKSNAPLAFESTMTPQFGAVTVNEPCNSMAGDPLGLNMYTQPLLAPPPLVATALAVGVIFKIPNRPMKMVGC